MTGAGTAGALSTGGGNAGASGEAGANSTLIECTTDEDCMVLDDCCACQAVVQGASSNCPLECAMRACAEFPEPPRADCILGQCVLDVSCYFAPLEPSCGEPPSCAPGMVPSAVAGCYGPCVWASECQQVSGCQDCAWPDQVCVFEHGAAGIAHCMERPEACASGPLCPCMGEICGEARQPCAELPSGISCGNG